MLYTCTHTHGLNGQKMYNNCCYLYYGTTTVTTLISSVLYRNGLAESTESFLLKNVQKSDLLLF